MIISADWTVHVRNVQPHICQHVQLLAKQNVIPAALQLAKHWYPVTGNAYEEYGDDTLFSTWEVKVPEHISDTMLAVDSTVPWEGSSSPAILPK